MTEAHRDIPGIGDSEVAPIDGDELAPEAYASGLSRYLPAVRAISIPGLNPIRTTVAEVLKSRSDVRDIIEELKAGGKVVIPTLGVAAVLLFVASSQDLLGGIGDPDLVKESEGRLVEIKNKIKGSIRKTKREAGSD